MGFDLPTPVAGAISRLEGAGFAAYAVGGCVRDWVLGIAPHDYDICTSAAPGETKGVFQGERIVETGVRHGTITVLLGGMPLEITTFRLDGEYLDGRRPASVRFTARVEEDLARRDFTVNAMAYAPRAGLVDPFGGRADCRTGLIRCVGDAETRFAEDALRILRALRFSARLGFPIQGETARALTALRGTLDKISRERVAAELSGLLLGRDAALVLQKFPEVLFSALPALQMDGAAWARTARRVGRAPREETLRWAALLAGQGADGARRALGELKMPARLIEAVGELAQWLHFPFGVANMQEMLVRLGPERLAQLLALRRAEGQAIAPGEEAQAAENERLLQGERSRLLAEGACYSLAQLAVNGRDLAGIGLRGKQIGAALNALLLAVARGEAPNDREALLARAEANPRG